MAERVRDLLDGIDETPRGQRLAARGGLSLSPREREVLDCLARGASGRDIAACLGIGPRTVKAHLTGLYNKLGVNTRQEALCVARERGLLEDVCGGHAAHAEYSA